MQLLNAELFEITGKRVIEQSNLNTGNSATINIEHLTPGVYIVRLLTSEGIFSENITIQ